MKIGDTIVLEKIASEPGFIVYVSLAAVLAIFASLVGNQGGCLRFVTGLVAGGFIFISLLRYQEMIAELAKQPDLLVDQPLAICRVLAVLLALFIGWRTLW